jgi:hypothetical protein
LTALSGNLFPNHSAVKTANVKKTERQEVAPKNKKEGYSPTSSGALHKNMPLTKEKPTMLTSWPSAILFRESENLAG